MTADPATGPGVPAPPITYQLYVRVRRRCAITPGRLGRHRLEPGWYVYTGSARRNMAARLRRHLGACPRSHVPTARVPQRHLWPIVQLTWEPPCSSHDRPNLLAVPSARYGTDFSNRLPASGAGRRWHIDWLLGAGPVDVEHVVLDARPECEVNRMVEGTIVIRRFGATDCRQGCGSHLLWLGTRRPHAVPRDRRARHTHRVVARLAERRS